MLRALLTARRRRQHARRAELRLLFVCRVNHCRSPLAEGVVGWKLEAAGLAGRVFVDSAGVDAQMTGAPPDQRALAAAAARGIAIGAIRSRPFENHDFSRFDAIWALDRSVHDRLLERCPVPAARRKVRPLLSLLTPAQRAASAVADGDSVLDPYYGGQAGFDAVLDLLEQAADALLDDLLRRLPPR